MSYHLVLSTVPSRKTAARIASLLVRERLAACVSILPGVRSFYRWKGKLENSGECLLLIKAKVSRFSELEKKLAKIHPYEVPEILACPVSKCGKKYLEWLAQATTAR